MYSIKRSVNNINSFVTLFHVFGDPLIVMWCINAVGHNLSIPILATLSYWNIWLLNFAIQALWPIESIPEMDIKKVIIK